MPTTEADIATTAIFDQRNVSGGYTSYKNRACAYTTIGLNGYLYAAPDLKCLGVRLVKDTHYTMTDEFVNRSGKYQCKITCNPDYGFWPDVYDYEATFNPNIRDRYTKDYYYNLTDSSGNRIWQAQQGWYTMTKNYLLALSYVTTADGRIWSPFLTIDDYMVWGAYNSSGKREFNYIPIDTSN